MLTEHVSAQQVAGAGSDSTPAHERSVTQLVADLSTELRRLIRDEIRLAVAELRQKGKLAGLGVGVAGFAAILAFLGAAALVAAAVLAIAVALPGWLSALIVGCALVMFAGLLGGFGAMQLKRSAPPVPQESMSGIGKDVDAAKGQRR